MRVPHAIDFTVKLFQMYNVKVLPGEFLAREDVNGKNPGKDYIRIALVENEEKTRDALSRIKECLGE